MEGSRQQFEAWFNSDVFSLKLADQKLVNCYWDAWQASRQAVELDLPKKYHSDAYFGNGCCDDYANEKLDEVYAKVRAAGLRIKGE